MLVKALAIQVESKMENSAPQYRAGVLKSVREEGTSYLAHEAGNLRSPASSPNFYPNPLFLTHWNLYYIYF